MIHARNLLTSELGGRVILFAAGLAIGLAAVAFAMLADQANAWFAYCLRRYRWWPLLATPLGFALTVWLMHRFLPGAAGSGIPQAIAASHAAPEKSIAHWLSLRIAAGKIVLTSLGMAFGASMGREGPSVQVGASIMAYISTWKRVTQIASRRNLIIAGGAAGVAAAFNTPLAGIMFAIEEICRHSVFRANSSTLTALIAAGLVSLGLLGNYSYFGSTSVTLSWPSGVLPVLAAGVLGGLAGGLFGRLLLGTVEWLPATAARLRETRPYVFAALAGLVVALLGIVGGGVVFGTGYEETRIAIEQGTPLPVLSGVAKALATWLSFAAGVPGGVFAPSLGVGAGLGSDLSWAFPDIPRSAVMLLVMVAYLAAMSQAPITASIIVMEMSRNANMMIPLMAAAVIGHLISRAINPQPLFFTLASRLLPELEPLTKRGSLSARDLH